MKNVQRRYREDVRNLTEVYGDLSKVDRIETTLQNLGGICERGQLKIVAYKGLTVYLKKAFGVELCITSRKSKKEKTAE